MDARVGFISSLWNMCEGGLAERVLEYWHLFNGLRGW